MWNVDLTLMKIRALCLSAIVIMLSALGAWGAPVSGNISTDTTWTRAEGPYYVTNDIIVDSFKTLTIAPGTVIKFAAGKGIIVNGTLNAFGTAAEKIYFTDYRDDSVGGDMNGDGPSSGAPGWWHGISVNDGQANLDYCEIRYAGSLYNAGPGSSPYFGVQGYGSSTWLRITNSVISDTLGNAFYSNGSSMASVITDNIFRNSSRSGFCTVSFNASGDNIQFSRNLVTDGVGCGVSIVDTAISFDGNTIKNHSSFGSDGVYISNPTISVLYPSLSCSNRIYGNYIGIEIAFTANPSLNCPPGFGNEIYNNASYSLLNSTSPPQTIDARFNWWGSPAGPYNATSNPGGNPNSVVSDNVDFANPAAEVILAPSITDISPASGSVVGGTSVTITGTNFVGATAVRFGSSNAPTFYVVSASQITATSPAGSTGMVDLTVTTPTGTSGISPTDQFIYVAANPPPTDITLSNATVAENGGVNTVVGTLATVDSDAGDTFTYSLASSSGCPGPDNDAFNINTNLLRTSAVLDFEVKNTYALCVRSSDSGGLTYDKPFAISVTDLCTLANGTVTASGDSGVGTLRQLIDEVCPGGTIDFAPAVHLITLSSDVLHISKDVTLAGPGANNLTIDGGGLVQLFQVPGAARFTLRDLTLAHGAAAGGGALLDNELATTTISGCVFSNNTALMGGGAILAVGTMTIRDTSFSGNTTSFLGYGGAIYGGSGTLSISNTLFNTNSAAAGGGITNSASTMTLTSVTMNSNNATAIGGAIYTGAPLTLVNATIVGNSASQGGGIAVGGGPFNLKNSIVFGNIAASGGPDIFGTVTSLGYNLIGTTAEATIDGITTGNLLGADPLLGSLADHGGPTQTMPLLVGSPAIDPTSSNGAPWLDQRGYLRSGTADRGAYEYGGTLPVATAATSITPTSFAANWQEVPGATDYRLEVATDSSFTSFVPGFTDRATGKVTTFPVSGLDMYTPYYYRIRASNGPESSSRSNSIGLSTLTDRVTAIVVDPGPPLKLYAAIDGGGVYRSSDGGATWLPPTAPGNRRVMGLTIHPSNHELLFGATYGGGVSSSTDGGDHWAACANSGLSGAGLNVLAVTRDQVGRLFVGSEAGVYRSLTVGDCSAWQATAVLPGPVGVVAVDPLDGQKIYVGLDGSGVYWSSNAGSSWTEATTFPITNKRVKALAIKPGDSTKLFAATSGNGVYQSSNRGLDWAVCNNSNLADLNVVSLTIDAYGRLYAGTEAGVFVSADACATWSEMNTGLPN